MTVSGSELTRLVGHPFDDALVGPVPFEAVAELGHPVRCGGRDIRAVFPIQHTWFLVEDDGSESRHHQVAPPIVHQGPVGHRFQNCATGGGIHDMVQPVA